MFLVLATGQVIIKSISLLNIQIFYYKGIVKLYLLVHDINYNLPAGLLSSGGGFGPAIVEALQAARCSVSDRQAAALLIQYVQIS